LSLTWSEKAADRLLAGPGVPCAVRLGIGERVIVSVRGEASRGGGGAPKVTCAKC
jgi:hypothetical protein